MPTITFVHPNGQHERVEASDGRPIRLIEGEPIREWL